MQEYEQSKTIAAPANEVFAWVSDVENLPRYLPPIKDAGIEGPASEGSPGERVKMRVDIPDRGEFESEGYFDVDAEARTMRWGAEPTGTTPAGSRSPRRATARARSPSTSPSARAPRNARSKRTPEKTATRSKRR